MSSGSYFVQCELCSRDDKISTDKKCACFSKRTSKSEHRKRHFERKFIRRVLRYLYINYRLEPADVTELPKLLCKRAATSTQRMVGNHNHGAPEELVAFLKQNLADRCIVCYDMKNSRYTIQLRNMNCVGNSETMTFERVDRPTAVCEPIRNAPDCVACSDDKTKSPKSLDQDDIFQVNKLIISSFAKNGDENQVVKRDQAESSVSSATLINHTPSKFHGKWPLARQRVLIPYSAHFRNAKRRLQMKVLLGDLTSETDALTERRNLTKAACPPLKGRSSLEDLKMELEMLREKENRRSNWLYPGITVRVRARRLGKNLVGRTADVIEVKQNYTALLRFHHDGSALYADQDHLETAILNGLSEPDQRVMLVNGAYRGCTGQLQGRSGGASFTGDTNGRGTFTVRIGKGVFNGRVLENVSAEDVASFARGAKC